MGWFNWLDPGTEQSRAAANSNSKSKAIPYQASLIPGDIGYLCDGCGHSLTGGFLGLGHCKCD